MFGVKLTEGVIRRNSIIHNYNNLLCARKVMIVIVLQRSPTATGIVMTLVLNITSHFTA